MLFIIFFETSRQSFKLKLLTWRRLCARTWELTGVGTRQQQTAVSRTSIWLNHSIWLYNQRNGCWMGKCWAIGWFRKWEAPGANVEAVRAAKENMEDKAADETDTNWRGNYSDDITEKLTGGSAASRRFLVQISAQNLSQILNVCVKVCTKQTQKGAYLQWNPFCNKSA